VTADGWGEVDLVVNGFVQFGPCVAMGKVAGSFLLIGRRLTLSHRAFATNHQTGGRNVGGGRIWGLVLPRQGSPERFGV